MEPFQIKKENIEELFQKENSVCQIKIEKIINDKFFTILGSGFFLNINDSIIPFENCLMTSSKNMDESDIKDITEIKIEFKNTQKIIQMKNRRTFSNKTLGYSCIEIFEEDDIEDILYVNNSIFKEKRSLFNNKQIFILQYLKNQNLVFSSGKILTYAKNRITHNCSITEGYSGLPIVLFSGNILSIIGMQVGYDVDNKCNIAIPILDIINDIKHQICPIVFNDDIDSSSLSEGIIKTLKLFPEIEENSFFSIISKKFSVHSIPKLAYDFAKLCDSQEFCEKNTKEIIRKLSNNTTIIFDSNKDSDTINNIMTKVYGKTNLAFFISFWKKSENDDKMIDCMNLIYLDGKMELINNNFEFVNKEVILFCNYANLDEDKYDYKYFKGQNDSVFIKNKNNIIYAVFYRKNKELSIKYIIKIMNNFMKYKAVYLNQKELISEKSDNMRQDINQLHKIDELFESMDNSKKYEINMKELIIYQINN